MPNLRDYLLPKKPSESLGNLSLVHTANGEDLLAILASKAIRPSACRVFDNEAIAYFFLARPAYKTSVVLDASYWQLPAIFIFDKFQNLTPARIYPFDTGAFDLERYKKIIGQIDRDDFVLGTSWDIVEKHIQHFFGDPSNYAEGQPRAYQSIRDDVGPNTSQYVALALAKLYNFPFNEQIDDRVRLVEVQYVEDVPLTAPPLRGIILCKEWMRDENIAAAITGLGCQVETYPLMPLSSASYYSKIYELAQTFL